MILAIPKLETEDGYMRSPDATHYLEVALKDDNLEELLKQFIRHK